MGMFTESPLFDDPSLPTGWYRKVVQRQTGATAGQWDVYVYNPEGKKFRSRNELRTHFNQIGSTLNSEDFDFSVKGKGHHNKGKSPSKKHEAENSKENQVSKKTITPVGRKSNTSKANATPIERPKRELRKRLHSKPEGEPAPKQEDIDIHEEIEEKEEVSNVKLKVKVGYTATGAMIRPSTNGNRKKKRRFRNMHVKKRKTEVKSVPKSPVSSTKRVSPIAPVVTNNVTKEEHKGTVSPRTRLPSQRNRKDKATEPVAGPSGLQKVKRSPRRILKRKGGADVVGEGADDSEESDDEDLDYVCSLYPNKSTVDVEDEDMETGAPEAPEEACDPLQINEEDVRAANCEANHSEDLHSCLQSYSEPLLSTVPVTDTVLFVPSPEAEPDETISAGKIDQANEVEATDDHGPAATGETSGGGEQRKIKIKVPSIGNSGTPGSAKKTIVKRKLDDKNAIRATLASSANRPKLAASRKVAKNQTTAVSKKSETEAIPAENDKRSRYFSVPLDVLPQSKDPRLPANWEPPQSPYNFIQEYLYRDPWQLLVATIFLNKTSGKVATPLIWEFLKRWKSAESARQADSMEIAQLMNPLGLHQLRAKRIIRMSEDYLKGDWVTPSDLYGISKYGSDSYRIFCLGQWRDVRPTDIMLRIYQDWLFTNRKALKLSERCKS